MTTLPEILALTALAALLAAAIADVRRFEIPDSLSVAILLLAVGFGLATPGFPWWQHLAAVALLFGLGLLAFARGWLGGGDVKLLVAIAGWTGLQGLPLQFALVAVAGGLLTLALVVARRVVPSGRGGQLLRLGGPIPYAVAIFAGTALWGLVAWPLPA